MTDTLNNTSYINVVDALGEGELQGFATPERAGISKNSAAYNVELLKDIFVDNSPVLQSAAVVKVGTYSQTTTTITVTCNNHGYSIGTELVLTVATGLAATGEYKVKTVTTNTFTVDSKNNNVTSGDIAIARSVDYNYKDLNPTIRYGSANQLPIAGFDRIESEIGVGLTVEYDAPVVRTLTNPNIDAVRTTISVPALQRFEANGDIKGSSFSLRIELAENGGSYYTALEDTITGQTGDQYQRDYEINLVGKTFPIDIRLVRTSADSTSVRVVNSFIWTSYTQITDGRLSYPNTALVASRFTAEQFSNIPSRAFRVRGRKVAIPTNATVDLATGALTYTGVWSGSFATATWTSDPAWCLWNLLTDYRAGFGQQLSASQLDKWAFFAASQYCSALNTYVSAVEISERAARGLPPRTGTTNDYNATTGKHGVPTGLGTYEPRFSCNVNIQTQTEAYNLINDLCSVMRCMPYWSTGSLTISQDAPADPSYLFTLANVTDAGFNYTASSQKTKPSVVLVSYLDLETRDIAYEQVEDQNAIKRFGVVTQEIEAFACTSRSQAHRLGEFLLYSNNYEAEVVSFTTSLAEGVVVRPGQVIAIADPMKAGSRRGGRISASTSTTITVDDATGLPLDGGTLSVIMPDGTVVTKPVTNRSGTTITVGSAYTTAPNANSIWIYENASVQTTTWRVIGIAEQEQSQYTISAVSYNSSKFNYIERGTALETRNITELNVPPATPANFSLSETLYTYQAEVRAKVIASWDSVPNAVLYKIRWRKDEGSWQTIEASAPGHEILNITPGIFEYEVYAVNGAGKNSNTAATASITALGKTAPPADVSNLTYAISRDLGVVLNWDSVTDLDIDTYEIRRGANWSSATLLAKAKATTYKIGYLDDGSYTYQVKALDTSGVYSTNAATISVTVVSPGATTISSSVQGPDLVLSWLVPAITTYGIAYYRITYGNSYATSTEVAKTQSTSFTLPITWTGSRTFWVAPVDLVGKFSDPPDSEVVTITAAVAPTITTSVGGTNATLNWTAVTGTVPTSGYEIRQGATFATATVLATITGTAYSFRATWSGAQTFWVVAKDTTGNYGSPASAVITVNAAGAPTLLSSFSGQNVVFNWGAVKGTLDTDFYRLKRGATWATATTIATIYSTAYTIKADWGGTQKFWLAAVDVNGVEGTPDDLDVIVTIPTAPTISQQVIDNNVLLRWNDVTQTLPILYYELRRGSTWASGTAIGTKQGGFTVVFETASNTYTYWLAGVDSAGNYGTPGSVTAVVNQPPDYVLQLDQNSTWAGTETNIYTDVSIGQVVNVNTTETWQNHFTSRGWSTPQDQINAGYTYFLMPTTSTASYVEEFDYGTLLAGTRVSATLTSTNVTGSTTITPTLSIRALSTDPWTDYSGMTEVFATQFRYFKVRYDFASSGGNDLLLLTSLNVRLDSKLRNDAGTGTANAGDSGGTTVNFGVSFVDVQSITVTPLSTSGVIAVYDFTDVPNPTSFKVLLFNTSGTRINGSFSWSARGV